MQTPTNLHHNSDVHVLNIAMTLYKPQIAVGAESSAEKCNLFSWISQDERSVQTYSRCI